MQLERSLAWHDGKGGVLRTWSPASEKESGKEASHPCREADWIFRYVIADLKKKQKNWIGNLTETAQVRQLGPPVELCSGDYSLAEKRGGF